MAAKKGLVFVSNLIRPLPGADTDVIPSRSRPPARTNHHMQDEGVHHETDIPAQQHPPQADPRLPHAHENQKRPDHHPPAPGQGPQAPGRLGLGPADKIRVRAEFDRCYGKGRKYHSRYFLLFFLPDSSPSSSRGPRLGIAASRKIGPAVRRNRIKRLIRETFRLNRELFPGNADMVIVAKRGIDPMQLKLSDVQKDLRIVLGRIRRDAKPLAGSVPDDDPRSGSCSPGHQPNHDMRRPPCVTC